MIDLKLWKKKKKELKLTLLDLAEITGISISSLKDIFRGATPHPRIDTVKAIETALQLEENEIIVPRLTDEEKQLALYISGLSDEEKQLALLISQLTEEETSELSNFVDYIISKRK